VRGNLKILLGLVLAVASFASGFAHDPFDLSCRVIVDTDHIEVAAVIGVDGARKLLAAAGFEAGQVADALKARGPRATHEYKPAVAAHFLRLRCDGADVPARAFSTLSEGGEIDIAVVYPRPTSGKLTIEAVCYDFVPELRSGLLVVLADDVSQLGAVLLSSSTRTLTVSLPPMPVGVRAPR
jgi:hypothetical protein